MNCKPGDLAVIVRGEIPENIGTFVDVIQRLPDVSGRPCWHVRASLLCKTTAGTRAREGFCFDDCLKPIRPPATAVSGSECMEVLA